MPATEIKVHAVPEKSAGKVSLQVWIGSPVYAEGICTTAHLTPAEALKLAARLTEAVNELPREASAADLGIAA